MGPRRCITRVPVRRRRRGGDRAGDRALRRRRAGQPRRRARDHHPRAGREDRALERVGGGIGVEGYGLWATIASTTALLAFADLGLGNGLLNITSAAHGQDDRRVAHHAVSSAWVLLWGVAATITVAFALLYQIVDWGQVFNVTGSLASEAGAA